MFTFIPTLTLFHPQRKVQQYQRAAIFDEILTMPFEKYFCGQ
jgi:hypothetical protein